MEKLNTERLSWGTLTAKLVALNLPVFLLAAIVPNHSRIAPGAGILLGVVAQYFIPPRGKHSMGLLIIAVVGAFVLALVPKSIL
jgi:hypothetical protein